MTDAIRFTAEIIKLQTMVDHSFRLTLDLPETQFHEVALLMEAFQRGALLENAAVPIDVQKAKEKPV